MVLGETENKYRDHYLEVLGAGEYSWQVFALDDGENILCQSEHSRFTKPAYLPSSPSCDNGNNNNSPPIPPPPGEDDLIN